ncbi:hypothetical protein EXIGLDRAFT_632655 [Exidia glandulosa HHB12029]|uniref:Uncharacterized protein n=1 Tax=Exidia glandulosa HHB12029 TaxID=1314781 RepID=A0A166NFQ2_EXIGL|nr:hypothetical protein EXIGLDRAFT_632655 [Exidia glandulosa HHB12029]
MPAVAKLMCMKGHNALFPCRFCMIRGIRPPGARAPALYVPLDRSSHPNHDPAIPRYDPANLPRRSHEDMLRQAREVDAASGGEAERLAKEYGIKGIPILAALPSIRLDRSFPVEFMHLVWLNLVPNLVLLYTGQFKGLDAGRGDYEFAAAIWEEIGRVTAASGAHVPSAFGARVPDLAKDKTHMIAETWCIWTMHIAPIVLRGRFREERYYTHFMQLVHLLELCLQLEISRLDVEKIRSGFVDWVERYEQYVNSVRPRQF